MANSYHLSIVLPTRKVFEGEVTEVILPAHDGETGILPNHENFVGILGTGALKYIHQGKDYWLAVSSGIYKVSGNRLSILAELAERGEDLKELTDAPAVIRELETEIGRKDSFAPETQELILRLRRERARLEVYRRTNLLN
jgi:F-type H+-transporting ATPase subunit epsilon